MLSHKSFATTAALAVLCFHSATSLANAADSDSASDTVCISGGGALYRHTGHPGKSQLSRLNTHKVAKCAQVENKALVLTSFLDAPGGQALMDGRTARASKQIDSQASASVNLTNLCVLRTLQRDLPAAREACDSAVGSALRERARIRRFDIARSKLADKRLAVAYSNRGVMHWLAGDSGASYGDLADARAIDPKAAFVTRNFELTIRVPAQVTLPVDPLEVG